MTPTDAEPRPVMPRWVKVSGIVVGLIVLVLVVILLTGHHGPGRHFHAGGPPVGDAPAGSVATAAQPRS